MVMTNPVGRPMKFDNAEDLAAAINEYFDYCDNRIKEIHTKDGETVAIVHPAPYTMSGLANRLGMDRDTLINYSHKENFSALVKAARNRVHEDVERRLMETTNQSGAIFNLKNNFGWRDKTEQDITSDGKAIAPILVEFVDGNEDTDTNGV
jgi:hypothetical protein